MTPRGGENRKGAIPMDPRERTEMAALFDTDVGLGGGTEGDNACCHSPYWEVRVFQGGDLVLSGGAGRQEGDGPRRGGPAWTGGRRGGLGAGRAVFRPAGGKKKKKKQKKRGGTGRGGTRAGGDGAE